MGHGWVGSSWCCLTYLPCLCSRCDAGVATVWVTVGWDRAGVVLTTGMVMASGHRYARVDTVSRVTRVDTVSRVC